MAQKKTKIVWTRRVYEFFCTEGNIKQIDREILAQRIAGMTVKEMAQYYSMGESTIHKHISDMMKIYDIVQKEYPDILNPRKESEDEKFMDTH